MKIKEYEEKLKSVEYRISEKDYEYSHIEIDDIMFIFLSDIINNNIVGDLNFSKILLKLLPLFEDK